MSEIEEKRTSSQKEDRRRSHFVGSNGSVVPVHVAIAVEVKHALQFPLELVVVHSDVAVRRQAL